VLWPGLPHLELLDVRNHFNQVFNPDFIRRREVEDAPDERRRSGPDHFEYLLRDCSVVLHHTAEENSNSVQMNQSVSERGRCVVRGNGVSGSCGRCIYGSSIDAEPRLCLEGLESTVKL
jgi:hypothetical protein